MKLLRSLAFLVGLLPALAVAQQFPTVPDHTVIGRIGTGSSSGPSQAIPFTQFLPTIVGPQNPNLVFAGPTTAPAAVPGFRALVGADLPAPGASSFGGVKSLTCSTSNWFNTLSTSGVFGCSQPGFADLTGSIAPSQLPAPTATTLGGVKSLAAVAHNFLTSISTAGQPVAAQPACSDISNATSYCSAAVGQLPGTTTNDSASAGNVGEYIESVIAPGSAVSVTTNAPKTITSISLTAGDWDVDGLVNYLPAASTSITATFASISGTTNTLDTTTGKFYSLIMAAVVPGSGFTMSAPLVPYRLSLSGTTTVFLIGQATFTVSTLTAHGIIRARRVR